MTTKAELQEQINELREQVEKKHEELRLLRIYSFTEIADLKKLADYAACLGPLWTTQAGARRPLGMLSTEHLENLTNGRWLEQLPNHFRYAQNELERRRIDTEMRKKPSLWTRFWDHALGRNV